MAKLGQHKAKKETVQSFPQSGVGVITLVYGPEGPEETPDYKTKEPSVKLTEGKPLEVVGCTYVVVKDYGKDYQAKNDIKEYFKYKK